MPEGDTVYRTAKNLHLALAGQELVRCDIRVPAFATVDLSGTVVDEVVSRGKHLLIRVAEFTIHSHLKMEGSWHVYQHGTKWRRPTWQARAILANDERVAVGFQLGLLEVVARASEAEIVGHLGPDPLGPDWDADEAVRRLTAEPGREIGLALLDQRVIAGLGNVYRNELCFLSGVLPTRPVGEVDTPLAMMRLAHRLINANKDRVDRTTTGTLRGATDWVYRRDRHACYRCGTTILRGSLGDNDRELRNTFWCPRCQT